MTTKHNRHPIKRVASAAAIFALGAGTTHLLESGNSSTPQVAEASPHSSETTSSTIDLEQQRLSAELNSSLQTAAQHFTALAIERSQEAETMAVVDRPYIDHKEDLDGQGYTRLTIADSRGVYDETTGEIISNTSFYTGLTVEYLTTDPTVVRSVRIDRSITAYELNDPNNPSAGFAKDASGRRIELDDGRAMDNYYMDLTADGSWAVYSSNDGDNFTGLQVHVDAKPGELGSSSIDAAENALNYMGGLLHDNLNLG